MSVEELASKALWFLMPGVSHQLGNALFTVHGRARLLTSDAEQLVQDQAAILDGSQRAQDALAVVRWLVGEARDEVVAVGAALSAIADCLRVPLRDRAFRLEVQPAQGTNANVGVAAADFALRFVSVVRLLCEDAAPGPGGELALELLPSDPGKVGCRIGVTPEPGALPFPVDANRIEERLAGWDLVGGPGADYQVHAGSIDKASRDIILQCPAAGLVG
jgi:hypothetical protein